MHLSNNTNKEKRPDAERLCPFIRNPYPDCYCTKMNGRKVSLAVRFCWRNYEQCQIYQRIWKKYR